jgi:hypothetical protein
MSGGLLRAPRNGPQEAERVAAAVGDGGRVFICLVLVS